MDEVVLQYKRDHDLSSGSIFVRSDGTKIVFYEFRHQSFNVMMGRFSDVLREYPTAAAFIERNDRPGLLPYQLPGQLVHLLREDPAEAIRQLNPTHQTIDLREDIVVTEKASIGLRVGHDSFADSFGDRLYCRAKEDRIECPGCGLWVPVETSDAGHSFKCVGCDLILSVLEAGSHWWTITSCELLGTNTTSTQRFFFPRAWNKAPPWILREDLEAKYNDWLKEKQNA